MSIQPFIVKRSKVLPMFSLLSNTVVHPHNSLSPENMVAVIPQPLTQQNPTNLHLPPPLFLLALQALVAKTIVRRTKLRRLSNLRRNLKNGLLITATHILVVRTHTISMFTDTKVARG